ncbi:MAG: PD40 domain-containing protein [Flavobacteriia bacterium]|nr:PD40 domain-containing protein [Flavobacteriia bacterium]
MKRLIPLLLVVITACSAEKYITEARDQVRNNDYEAALININKAVEKEPDNVDAWLFRGDLGIVLNDEALAMNSYRKAYEVSPDMRILDKWGRTALDYGYYQKADSIFGELYDQSVGNVRVQQMVQQMQDQAKWAQNQVDNPVDFNPLNMGPNVNRLEMQYFPAVTADGNTLMFTGRNLSDQNTDEDFYVTSRVESDWDVAEMLPGRLNTPRNEGAMCLSADGKVIFYTGCTDPYNPRTDSRGSCDIYVSFKRPDGTWTEGRNLGDNINTAQWETQPTLSPDGKTLFFVRGRNTMAKNTDIFYSVWDGNSWSEAQRLPGDLNTDGKEEAPFIHFDGRTMYFASNGHMGMGQADLFKAELLEDGTWGNVTNLGYPINTYRGEFGMVVAPDGRTAYYASDRGQALDNMQLYSFELPENARATPVAWVTGIVVDDETNQPVDAELQFVDIATGRSPLTGRSGESGEFTVSLPANASYAVNVSGESYLFYSENFTLQNQTEASAVNLEIRLKKLSIGDALVLENVFFDTDSDVIDPSSESELNRLAVFLKQNPTVKLGIDGHTDNRGDGNYNMDLSRRRARSIVEFLVGAGIDQDRLEARGFGDTKPKADNSTAEGRALNRRTEMTILNL